MTDERRSGASVGEPAQPVNRNGRHGQRPAFWFYPADFLADENISAMTPAEIGATILLLCHQWRHGALPDDPAFLARLCRMGAEEFTDAWTMIARAFPKLEHGGYANKRMEVERRLADEFASLQAEKGRQGGLKTQEIRRSSRAQAEIKRPFNSASSRTQAESSSSSSSSSSGTPLSTEARPTPDGAVAPPSPAANGQLFPSAAQKRPKPKLGGPQAEFVEWFSGYWLSQKGIPYVPKKPRDYTVAAELLALPGANMQQAKERTIAMLTNESAFYNASGIPKLLSHWNELGAIVAQEKGLTHDDDD